MARRAESDQILGSVIAQSAPRPNVGDLKIFHSPAPYGIASRLDPGPRGIAGDTLPDQASIVAVWLGSQSKYHLHFFKELLSLWLRKTSDQPSEKRQ